jgi:hypothetical protein
MSPAGEAVNTSEQRTCYNFPIVEPNFTKSYSGISIII